MALKKDYGFLDTEHGVTPYVLPPIACGWYEHTGQFGEKTVYQFRRMPRAGKYTGKYGLWLKDKDAGMVLIGFIGDVGHLTGMLLPVEETTIYRAKFDAFKMFKDSIWVPCRSVWSMTTSDDRLYTAWNLTKRACSWCGRELLDATRLCHDKPMCIPGGIKKGKVQS